VSHERFAVVAFAPTFIREDLRKIRALCTASDAPLIDAHVTVKGVFEGVTDLAPVRAAIPTCVAGVGPFPIRTTEPEVLAQGERASIILPLEPSRPLAQIHDRLVAALVAHGSHPTPLDAPGGFRPRVTVVNGIPVEGLEHSLRAVQGWRPNYAWTVRELDLIGLPPDRASWHTIERYEFGRP
jgi:hypothetical protein